MSRKQRVFRVAKNRDNPYVMVDKQFIEYPGLSFRAKGVLLYILSKPDHWRVSVKDIMAHSKDGRDAVYASLKELTEHGYLQRVCYREKGKISQYEYIVYEQPPTAPSAGVTYTIRTESQETALYEDYLQGNPETVSPKGEDSQDSSLHSDIPETAPPPDSAGSVLPLGKPYPANPTQVSNDFSNKLSKNNTCSSRARCTVSDLWQEIFQAELTEREYDALLNVCPPTTVVRNLCLIEEHHCVSSILAPFPFVMSCIKKGGYKVPKKGTSPERQYEKKEPRELPKAVQQQLAGKRVESPFTPEELAKKKAEIQEKIRRMYEEPEIEHRAIV